MGIKSFIKSGIKHLDPEYVLWNISLGLHSNFPLCCVMWHTFVHAPYWEELREKIPHLFNVNSKERKEWFGDTAGYVRCPKCLVSGYSRPVHYCNEKCAPKKTLNPAMGLKVYKYEYRRTRKTT